MKKDIWKKVLLQLIGFLLTGVELMGYYPLGLSYFVAAYKEKVMRISLFPVMFIGMSLVMEPLALAKYGLCMVVAATVTSIMELDKSQKVSCLGSVAAGISTAAMEYITCVLNGIEMERIYMGLLEGVLVFAGAQLFRVAIGCVIKEKKIKSQGKAPEDYQYKSKELEKMEGIAKAFKSLAVTFTNLSDGSVQSNMGIGDISAGSISLTQNQDMAMLQKVNAMWHYKFCENRLAIAGQLNEMAHIISDVAKDTYQVQELTMSLEEKVVQALKGMHIKVRGLEIIQRPEKGIEVYANICSKKNRCIMTKDVAMVIGNVCGKKMIASKDSKVVVYKEYSPIVFVEDVNFNVLYGVSRRVKTGERISGDNFAFMEGNGNKAVLALSDGMGSGLMACQESEMVIELIEQFMEAGFCKETAARMINSSIVVGSGPKLYSTIDISEIDLRSGVCEFLKVGAAVTYVKRGNWVETIQSTSLPAGMFEQVEFDTTAKKLYDGDYVIMVSDGTLDAISGENKEQILKNIIWNTAVENPKDMAEYIIDKILEEGDGYIPDDMTVLVAGIWRK